MTNNNFYKPEEVRPLYGEIVPAYQAAFSVDPWNEVSKCVDKRLRCTGGLSAVAIGNSCGTCELRPTQPAYEPDELIERFDSLALSRPTAWYTEQNETGLTMASVAWKATPGEIVEEKYQDTPEMVDWMAGSLSDMPVMWLDEVFANRDLRSNGNLRNFGKFVVGLAKMLDCNTVAYGTVEPRMTYSALRDFGVDAAIFDRNKDVPDRRDSIIISNIGETA